MAGARKNKTQRNRISHSTRAIFYENIKRGLTLKVRSRVPADQIRWLMSKAFISRTQAQRLVNSPHDDPSMDQGCSIDMLYFIADAFGVTPPEFLTQGCKFAKDRPTGQTGSDLDPTSSGTEDLQRRPSRGTTRRRAS